MGAFPAGTHRFVPLNASDHGIHTDGASIVVALRRRRAWTIALKRAGQAPQSLSLSTSSSA